ncbi:hypothetical protein K7X08_032483 [Anisodus acutangulus]|uniref:Uncharacterized protein n=1 Tax=Anisodus acutangulus TaxID=402998 RepID=A0A9Q1LR89_9SOLA|nr:hypothetical protein K7X08_032483 [Anisodus acutangulus]
MQLAVLGGAKTFVLHSCMDRRLLRPNDLFLRSIVISGSYFQLNGSINFRRCWAYQLHITNIMELMRSGSIDYPEYYDPSDVIMDVFFCSALIAVYDDIVVKSAAEQRSIEDVFKEYEFNDQILDYVAGDHPQPFCMSWVDDERVFLCREC